MDFDEVDKEARSLLVNYHKYAILLHRPYPPQPSTTRNSFFGGLPNLPADVEWPSTAQGVPMHFLCQIDLSEIEWATELPSEGFLYFFMNESEDADWGDDESKDNCRVLYRPPSGDLPPSRPTPEGIQDCEINSDSYVEAMLPREKHRKVHVKWPIQFLKIETYPDVEGLPTANEHIGKLNEKLYEEWDRVRAQDARFFSRIRRFLFGGPTVFARMEMLPSPPQKPIWDKYAKILPLYRGLALERTTGWSINRRFSWEDEKRDAKTLLSAGLFPWLWLDVSYFSRFMLSSMRAKFRETDDLAGPTPMQEMRAWLDRSLTVDQTQPLSPEDRRAFVEWLNQLQLRDESPEPSRFHSEIRTSLMCTIRELAHDPVLFSAIDERIVDLFAKYFPVAELEGSMIDLEPRFYFSQMLGHPSLAQSTWLAEDPDACLLHLSTDYGLDWTFADAGALTFCLPHAALVARDFSQVRGILEGG